MTGTILISTHRLPLAGALREAFRTQGDTSELVQSPEELAAANEPALLLLTGERSEASAERWVQEATGLGIPVFASFPAGAVSAARARALGVEELLGPSPDPNEVVSLAKRTIERRRLQKITGIVGEADAMREALERVVQIAPVDSTVVVTGESGTGKELVARGIHALSSRRHRAFLGVNVSALSETLLESELFGHEKGAFTGAIDSRKGFFELAHKGTLFLDEIGEMPLSTQTKLLRVLEEREFLRVGGEAPIRVDVRIIAATNQDLRDLVAAGRFRRDLFYRLNILGIELPPLRRRRGDVRRLISHFVRELTQRLGLPSPAISEEAMQLLVDYDWPGNVRELRNLVESMVVLAPRRPIGPADLPAEIRHPGKAHALLPAPVPALSPASVEDAPAGPEARRVRPELEFVFRTLVELRVDMDQLRRDFEVYRDDVDHRLDRTEAVPLAFPIYSAAGQEVGTRDGSGTEAELLGSVSMAGNGWEVPAQPVEKGEGGSIVFRPGMTMDAIEEEAIRATLVATGGNRRRAAESLGIGERTLYRKIRKYGIEES